MTPTEGAMLEAARLAAKLLIELAGDRAREVLTEEEVRRANAVADALERAKFPEG